MHSGTVPKGVFPTGYADRWRGCKKACRLAAAVLADELVRGEEAVELAQQYGVTASDTGAPISPSVPSEATTETRRYLAAVLLDFATADPDASAEVLSRVVALGRRAGVGAELERLVGAELDLGERARTRMLARAAELAAGSAANVPDDAPPIGFASVPDDAVPDDATSDGAA